MKTKTFKIIIFLLFIMCYVFPDMAFAEAEKTPSSAVFDKILKIIEKEYPSLETLYKHLHANPELSLQEKNTSKRIASELEQAGYGVTRNVGGYGVVGIMKNGEGPTVMIRTDMDALPIEEKTGLPYASKVRAKDAQGREVCVMHACGHDIHMTVFIGMAKLLSQIKDLWKGTLVMVGQPAEESGGGARSMIAEGLFTRFPRPDYALALHDAPFPAGMVSTCEGYILANVDSVDITVRGVGGHGGMPQDTKDPIVMASQLVLALQTIVSREMDPNIPAVVTVGSIHGGTKHNIIPDEVFLQLTVRSYGDNARKNILASIKRITKGIAVAAGVPEDRMPIVKVGEIHTPATYNDPELTRRITKAFRAILGDKNVFTSEPATAGEDFAEYGRVKPRIPICIFWLGAVDSKLFLRARIPGERIPTLHSPYWSPLPDMTIKTGMKAMGAAVLELMGDFIDKER